MTIRQARAWRRIVAGAALCLAVGAAAARAQDAEQSFRAEMSAEMDRMMQAMNVPASGNVDRDFVESMIPHHQGAIDMAQSYLRYGHNEQLRRIAQEIVVEQQQEIVAMRLAIGDQLPPAAPAPTQIQPR